MKNKIIITLLVLIILSIYPIYRYKSNAKILAMSIIEQTNTLGDWSYGAIRSDFSGNIFVRDLKFTPVNFEGGFDIDSLEINTEAGFIFKNSSDNLKNLLPNKANLAFNTITFNSKSDDLINAFRKNSLWMAVAGYAGSFGCSRGAMEEFLPKDIEALMRVDQVFNLDLYYSRLPDFTIDVDFIIDAENMFSSIWAGNIESSYVDDSILLEELLVKKLYYSYLDNGFNLKRNMQCASNLKGSVAAYRISASEHLQRFFRVNFTQELPQILLNWYQRNLMPDADYNVVIDFPERYYLSELFSRSQKKFFAGVEAQVSLTETEYQKVTLKRIDFTKVDQEELMKQHIKKQEEQKQVELARKKEEEQKNSPTVYKIGSAKQVFIPIKDLNSYISRQFRIKTSVGRPIIGELMSVHSEIIVIKTAFNSGNAELSLPIKKILSAELMY